MKIFILVYFVVSVIAGIGSTERQNILIVLNPFEAADILKGNTGYDTMSYIIKKDKAKLYEVSLKEMSVKEVELPKVEYTYKKVRIAGAGSCTDPNCPDSVKERIEDDINFN